MRAKSMVLILIAGGCGLVASIGISQVMSRNKANTGPAMEMTRVLVAAHDLDIGDKLDAQSLRYEEWPKDRVPEGAMTDLEALKEVVPNTRLYEGEPILKRKLIDNLADSLPPIPEGYRVVPLKVSEAVAPPLLLPGDKVDILVFLRRSSDVDVTQTKTVLTDVRVYAVNHQTERIVEDDKTINAKTVSVLLTPKQVELLMLASEMGSIRLSLRGHNDRKETEANGTDVNTLVGNAPEKASEDDGPANSGGPSLSELLEQMKKSEPQVQAVAQVTEPIGPAHEMTVHTPDGVVLYTWRRSGQLPDVRRLGSGGAPATAPELPAEMLDDDQSASSGGEPADGGYLPGESEEQPSDDSGPALDAPQAEE